MISEKSKHSDYVHLCLGSWGSLPRGGQEFSGQRRGSRVFQGVGREAQAEAYLESRDILFRVAEMGYMIKYERKQIWGNLAETRLCILDYSL